MQMFEYLKSRVADPYNFNADPDSGAILSLYCGTGSELVCCRSSLLLIKVMHPLVCTMYNTYIQAFQAVLRIRIY
jgi:hypothetical protein